MAKVKISPQTNIMEVMKDYPQTRKVFDRHGMGCRGCMGAAAETIAAGAVTHGLDPKILVKELNEALKGRKD